MSKKNRKHSQEIPQVGNALELPNYVIPTTDLGCGPAPDRAPVDTRLEDCRTEDCRTEDCRTEDCRTEDCRTEDCRTEDCRTEDCRDRSGR